MRLQLLLPPLHAISVAGIQACDTLQVEAPGFYSAAGIYVATGDRNSGHPVYAGPNGAVLRYELTSGSAADAFDLNWGARDWLHGDGWYLISGGRHRFGLVTAVDVASLPTLQAPPWQTREGASGAVSLACSTCLNAPNWADGVDCLSTVAGQATKDDGCLPEGWTCEAFQTMGWCSGGAVVAGFEPMIGAGHQFPENNCCVCGGSWVPTVEDALSELQMQQDSVKALEAAVSEMQENMSSAEQALIEAERKAEEATKGFIEVRNQTVYNKLDAHNLTRQVADMRGTTDIEEKDLAGTGEQATELFGLTKDMDGVHHQQSNAENLNALEELNQRIWAAADAESDTGIARSLTRVSNLLKDSKTFHGRLRGLVDTVLVQRFRPGAHEIRHALRGLQNAVTLGVDPELGDEVE